MYFSWRKGENEFAQSRELFERAEWRSATLLEVSLRNVEPVLTGARFGATAQRK
jgi:hypothetical protein